MAAPDGTARRCGAHPTLIGIDVFTTSSVAQVPAVNAFGFITSNGIDGGIGDI